MKTAVISSIVWIPLVLLISGLALMLIGSLAAVWKQLAGLGIIAFIVWQMGRAYRE